MEKSSPLHYRLTLIEIEVAALLSEKEEILAALKVWDRYAKTEVKPPVEALNQGSSSVSPPERPQNAGASLRAPRNMGKGSSRPDGIPTIWEMTELLFRESLYDTLSIDEIIGKIRDRWWPGCVKAQIAPTVYGFTKDGRLKLVKPGEFALLRESTPARVEKPKAEHAEDMFGPLNPTHARDRQ